MMSSGSEAALELMRRYAVPRSEAMGRLLRRGIREGEFRKVDVHHAAVSIVSMVVFYFKIAPMLKVFGMSDAGAPSDVKRRKREVLDFVRHALFVDPEGDVE
jgi:hypothetical protein